MATATHVHEKVWEVSILLRDAHQKPRTWTKITGGICSWPQFNNDRDDVSDPHSKIDVLESGELGAISKPEGKRGRSAVRSAAPVSPRR